MSVFKPNIEKEKRSFSPNGTVDPQNHFYVDPRDWNQKNLLPSLLKGGFYTLLAPSQTGETTKCKKLIEMIQEDRGFTPIL